MPWNRYFIPALLKKDMVNKKHFVPFVLSNVHYIMPAMQNSVVLYFFLGSPISVSDSIPRLKEALCMGLKSHRQTIKYNYCKCICVRSRMEDQREYRKLKVTAMGLQNLEIQV